MVRRVTVYFATRSPEIIKKIRERFGMPMVGMTVNGELKCEIKEEDWELLKATERMGYIKIRNK